MSASLPHTRPVRPDPDRGRPKPHSGDAVRGGEAGRITFRVPKESASATTVKVTVDLAAGAPVAVVDTQPVTGRTATTTATLQTPAKDGDLNRDIVTRAVTGLVLGGLGVSMGAFGLRSSRRNGVRRPDQ